MKRISPAGVTFIVVAIMVGLGAAYAVRHLSRPAEQQAKAAGRKMAKIVVAKYNLGQYTRIIDDYVEEVAVPADKVPEGAVTLKSRALYRLAKVTIPAGQPIREQDLYEVGEVPLLSERLPPGYRAVTLAVDAKAAVNGMIQPESLVDITLTVKNDRPEFGGMATLTLLRRVRVLATSRNRFPAAEDRPTDLRNITVAVTPEQANKLILAEKYGTLSVVLCSQQEDGAVPTDHPENSAIAAIPTATTAPQPEAANQLGGSNLVNIYTLLGISPLQPQPETLKPETKTAQIWRGSEVQEVTFASWQIREAENATLVAQGREPQPFTPGALNGNASAPKANSEEDCPECAAKRAKEAARASAGSASPTPAPHPAVLPGQANTGTSGYGRVVTVPVARTSAARP